MEKKHQRKAARLDLTAIVTAIVIATVGTAILIGSSSALAKAKYEFTHYDGYEAGLKAAQDANKPILLDFYFDT